MAARVDGRPAESAWTTSNTLFEAPPGLALLPPGQRRQAREAAFAWLLEDDPGNRPIDFKNQRAKTGKPALWPELACEIHIRDRP